jgi:hypothetical protein
MEHVCVCVCVLQLVRSKLVRRAKSSLKQSNVSVTKLYSELQEEYSLTESPLPFPCTPRVLIQVSDVSWWLVNCVVIYACALGLQLWELWLVISGYQGPSFQRHFWCLFGEPREPHTRRRVGSWEGCRLGSPCRGQGTTVEQLVAVGSGWRMSSCNACLEKDPNRSVVGLLCLHGSWRLTWEPVLGEDLSTRHFPQSPLQVSNTTLQQVGFFFFSFFFSHLRWS